MLALFRITQKNHCDVQCVTYSVVRGLDNWDFANFKFFMRAEMCMGKFQHETQVRRQVVVLRVPMTNHEVKNGGEEINSFQ